MADPERGPAPRAGSRVRLRRAGAADVPALAAILAEPEVAQWWPRESPETCAALVASDDEVAFVVEHEGRTIGLIQYWEETDPDYRHAGIDIALHPAWHGRGLGTEAVRTLARFLFQELHHHRVTIDPAAANHRAIRCYEKVGFRPVGVTRRSERGPDGTWHDGLLMDLLAGELR